MDDSRSVEWSAHQLPKARLFRSRSRIRRSWSQDNETGYRLDEADVRSSIARAIADMALARARFWQAAADYPLNDRQRAVLHRMLGDFAGHLNTSKYAKLAKCSTDTALRDIRELLQWGLVVRNPGGGRSTSYSIAG